MSVYGYLKFELREMSLYEFEDVSKKKEAFDFLQLPQVE